MSKKNLPTLQELVSDVEIYKKQDELNYLLNQEPPKNWIKTHPYIKNHKYLPIDKIEYLLRKIFKEYRIEILREGTSFNGVYVAVRLHYKNLTDGSWSYHDGIGAAQLQTKKGSNAADLNNINDGALSMAFPIAKTIAIKDAADMFGKLFGSDLNRRDTLPAAMDNYMTPKEKSSKIKELMNDERLYLDEMERMNIERIIEQKEVLSYDKAIKLLTEKLNNYET